jgi:hypothetical protein
LLVREINDDDDDDCGDDILGYKKSYWLMVVKTCWKKFIKIPTKRLRDNIKTDVTVLLICG